MSHKKNENKTRNFNKEDLVITPKDTISVKRDKFNKGFKDSVENKHGEKK